jgi:hypothetical protein
LLVSEITFDSEYVDSEVFSQFESQAVTLEHQQISNIYELINTTNFIRSTELLSSSSTRSNEIIITNHLTLQTLIMILITLLALL